MEYILATVYLSILFKLYSPYNLSREPHKQKMSKNVEKVKKVGGSAQKNKKSTIQNVDYFEMKEGDPVFPSFKMTELWS